MKFKITGSTASNLTTEPKLKADKEAGNLSEGAKTYIKKWIVSNKYNRKEDIKSKYMDKGLRNEDDNLDFISMFFDIEPKLINNKDRKENGHFSGEYDAMNGDTIIDLKSSWDVFTFGKNLFVENTQESIKKNFPQYYWQAQVYLDLWDKEDYELIYVLSDTPEDLIMKEHAFNNPKKLEYNEFKKNFIFDDIPDSDKILVFNIKRDDDDIDYLKNKVEKAREYIKELNK